MAKEPTEFLVLSRGKWDPHLAAEEIQTAIDDFYVWLERLVQEGRMKPGYRLTVDGCSVSKNGITDGPYGEAKEVIGGYWFIVAGGLEEAARMVSGNPCLKCGLVMEVRPIDPERASASSVTNETPGERRG